MLVRAPRKTTCFLVHIFMSLTLAFNVDVDHSIVYSGQPGTFFGYSVAMAKNNNPGETTPTILIGAPKDNYNGTKFIETGVLYTCKPAPDSCVSIRVDSFVKHLSDLTTQNVSNAWIGGTIDVNPKNPKILTCGHRWKDWSKTDSGTITVSMVGICYLGELGKTTFDMVRPKSFGGNAGMGEDAVFSKDGSEIIVGVPGFANFSGAVVTFETSNITKEKMFYNAPYNSNSYAGYSVSSGTFFSDKLEYYVMGAPRYDNTGAVFIVNKVNAVKQKLTCKNKLGAYCGSSLAVTDINGDGYDDLLVGVPRYSKNILERGAVMLYLSDGQSLSYNRTIWGMEMERGQFGTVIQDVGDINNDGYHDIVIGAPYENNREGAIYIYNLGKDGFPANFSQRISGRSVGQGQDMKGFGISISGAVDINNDSYPDFLVGSYLTSKVHLLKARPVLALEIEATSAPDRIDVNNYNCAPYRNSKSICLDLSLTVSYHTPNSYFPDKIELDFKMYTDVSSLANNASSSVHRALIKTGSQYGESKHFNLTLSKKTPINLNFELLIKDKTDIFSPIGVFFDYKIHDGSLTNCSKLCPVLKGNQYKKLIHYNLDCGPDEQCTSDLHLSLDSNRKYILYGKMQTFHVHVSVFNDGENAYNSLALFNFPSYVQYVQVKNTDETECSSANEELVRCSLGNPISKNDKVTFTLEFTSANSLQENEININASVKTKSEEKNVHNNQAAVKIPVRMEADINFNGFSEPNMLHLSKTTSLLQHNFEIYNNGPSPLLDTRIKIIVPELTEFVSINCAESTLKNCTTEFSLENLDYGKRKLIKVVFNVDASIFKKAKDIKSLKTTAKLTRKSNPLYLDDKPNWSLTAEIITNLQTETKPVSSWVIIISILAGLIVLALMIVILWKVGFFKRKKAGDLDPLTADGKSEQPNEKETLQEKNGNTSVPVKDEEKVALSNEAGVQAVEV